MTDAERFAGMTVNERLFALGTLDGFDEAVRQGDRGKIIDLLREVELADQAEWIADSILAHPSRYGRI